jgi:hypothetical protein
MFDRILKNIRDKIRTNQYIMTLHAEEEMDNDGLSILDIERCILNGTIIGRHKDRETGEWKYTINGRSVLSQRIEIITKISITGKLAIITIYKL